ncbi:MAG: hypothetical protein LLG15_10390 [Betaproteobacteria bacterium]|nr:hypothetical protein [Betaproteobacteria bacterium]
MPITIWRFQSEMEQQFFTATLYQINNYSLGQKNLGILKSAYPGIMILFAANVEAATRIISPPSRASRNNLE